MLLRRSDHQILINSQSALEMNLDSILDSLRVIEIPMRTTFRGINRREIALIEGPEGWGEFSPFLEYDAVESAPWLASALESAFRPSPQTLRDEIPINGTVPALDEKKEIQEVVSWYQGASVFKVKVGGDLKRDLQRIRYVVEASPSATLRIDVNGNWSVSDAITSLTKIHDEFGSLLEYVEQPVTTLAELKELKSKLEIDIKIAGDEVIRKAKNPFELELAGAVDVLMLKVAPLGGIARAMKIAAHHGLPVVVSSALESSVGIAHGLRLAGALPHLDYACGLATGALFYDDLNSLTIRDGKIRIPTKSEQVVKLEELAAPNERIEWWRNRIIDCWEAAL